MRDFINYEKVERLSKLDINEPLWRKVSKVAEEVGELHQAHLGYDGSKNVSASAGTDIMDVVEEACDTINCALDVLNHIELHGLATPDAIAEMFKIKLQKWEDKTK